MDEGNKDLSASDILQTCHLRKTTMNNKIERLVVQNQPNIPNAVIFTGEGGSSGHQAFLLTVSGLFQSLSAFRSSNGTAVDSILVLLGQRGSFCCVLQDKNWTVHSSCDAVRKNAADQCCFCACCGGGDQ
jgi:hypothetical protein